VERLFPIKKHDLQRRLRRLALVLVFVVIVRSVRQASLTRTQGRREGLR
jgi:hypothetical protein